MKLNSFATYLISVFSKSDSSPSTQEGIRVNPIVSELATWYEKIRNAMDYRDEEVVLRAAIERILKRRHFYGGNGKTIAAPLLRELTWARYFPDGSISKEHVEEVESVIDLYLQLRKAVLQKHKIDENEMNVFMYHLISSHLTYLLSPNVKGETMANFMFHVMKKSVVLADDPEATRDVQVFIATRRAFAKDDKALLHYHLFIQYFGKPAIDNLEEITTRFIDGYKEIKKQLHYPLRHKIFSFIKRNTPSFLVLEKVLLRNQHQLPQLLNDSDKLTAEITDVCNEKYKTIRSKVNRAIIRSIVFLILTKTVIALSVEGTFESIVYGHIVWSGIIVNIVIPPILLACASFFIKTPDKENTKTIINQINSLLFDPAPQITTPRQLQRRSRTKKSVLYPVFSFLWVSAFIASFGLVVFILTKINLNIISQALFVFFLTIVFFLIYRINQTAHSYTVTRKQNLLTPIIDFFFMPIASVGRHITEGVSQMNIFLVLLDLLIEAPFKGIFAFFEQWFVFLHSKREYLE